MSWAESQRDVRDRQWPRLERLLDTLPPGLAASFRILQYDLALSHTSNGRFRDIFMGIEQPPVLWIASWLSTDSHLPRDAEKDDAEQRLFVVSVLLAAREHLVRALLDTESFAAEDQLALAVHLSERIAAELAFLPGGYGSLDHSFGEEAQRLPQLDEAPEAYLLPRWDRPMRLLAGVAKATLGLPVPRTGLDRMLSLMATGFEVRLQLATLHTDLLQGRTTFPIVHIARTARIPLRPWPPAEVMLGAMIVTSSVPTILEAARARLEEARTVAEGLELGTFAGFLGDAAHDVTNRIDRIATGTSTDPPRAVPLISRSEPSNPRAIAMARGYLLSDLSFRESFESHREGMFGVDEVVSRFPAGLVLEILAAHGLPVTRAIDDFLTFTGSNGFRYYEHPMSGIDTDTIGVFLRLLRHARASERHLAAAQPVLTCLERAVEQSGVVPVWLRGCEGATPAPVVDLGEGCGTVAAQLLLGLCAVDDRRHDPVVDVGARSLLGRIPDVGLGANVNYPPTFALASFIRLATRVADRPGLTEVAGAARSALRSEVERRRKYQARTAQDAALITIACLDAASPELLDAGWRRTILRQQRFDGSWAGEPFAAAPNRGDSVTWYASATMTTALAYDALERWSRVESRTQQSLATA